MATGSIPDPAPLTQPQLRVLGTLIKLQFTRPDHYPSPVDVIAAGCNQPLEHEDIKVFEKSEVHSTLMELIRLGLVSVQQTELGFQYLHNATKLMHLGPAQLALMSVLFLHGPQTSQEILDRSYRLYPFRNCKHVDDALASLGPQRAMPLVKAVRLSSSKTPRYLHLFQSRKPAEQIQLTPPAKPAPAKAERIQALENRVKELEQIVNRLASDQSKYE